MSIKLYNALDGKTGAINKLSEVDKNNFLFHLIAKGVEYYNNILIGEIDFCTYLLENNTWQNLYSFMEEVLNKN